MQLSVVPEKEKEKEASDGLSKRAAKRVRIFDRSENLLYSCLLSKPNRQR